MNIWERSDVRPGQTLAIVGSGFLGLLLTQLATHAGAHVVAISRRASALEAARLAGAAETVSLEDPWAAREQALRLTDGRGYDRVIEAGGLQATLDVASAIAAEYGRLVIAGYHQDGTRQVDVQQWNWKALDVINAHERSIERYAGGVQRAIDAILAGRMDPFRFLTHDLPVQRLDEAFEMTRSRPDGFVKAVVRIGAST
jgi:threonine dehydrogenase-like Zn-dependent dehydrogenase